MKESLRLFVTVLLIALACLLVFPAESWAEYVSMEELKNQAEQGWHQTYEAYGRTIAVDVPVTLPQTDAFPVLRVKKISAVAANLLGDFSVYTNKDGYLSMGMTPKDLKTPGNDPAWFKTSFVLTPDAIDWDKHLSEDVPFTPREAWTLFDGLFSRLYARTAENDLVLQSLWVRGRMHAYDKKTKTFGEPVTDFGGYEFDFLQKIGDIPVLVSGERGLSPTLEKEIGRPGSRTHVSIFTKDFFNLYIHLTDVVSTPCPDVPLLPLDAVKAEYEKLITAGRLREVSSLSLGYGLYTDPVQKDIFWAIPVWVLQGIVYGSAREEAPPPPEEGIDTRPDRSVILLAQLGTMMPEYDESLERWYVPQVVTWEDVR